MTRAQGKHREFSLNQSVATLYLEFIVISEIVQCTESVKCKRKLIAGGSYQLKIHA